MNDDKHNHAKQLAFAVLTAFMVVMTAAPTTTADAPLEEAAQTVSDVLAEPSEYDSSGIWKRLGIDPGMAVQTIANTRIPSVEDVLGEGPRDILRGLLSDGPCEDGCGLGDLGIPDDSCEGEGCDDLGLLGPLVCTGSGCVDVSRESSPKCRWWNQWEADVEVLPEGNAALNGVSLDAADAWEVEGEMGCSGETDESCSVDDTPDACTMPPVDGSGKLKCDLTIRVGVVPENWFVEITCKDPVNPCGIVRTTLRTDPVTGEAIKDYHVPVCEW